MLCPKKIANHENVVVIPVVVMTVTLWIKFAEPESRKQTWCHPIFSLSPLPQSPSNGGYSEFVNFKKARE